MPALGRSFAGRVIAALLIMGAGMWYWLAVSRAGASGMLVFLLAALVALIAAFGDIVRRR